MKSWALRVAVVLLAVLALAGAAYVVFDAERNADAVRASQGGLEHDAAAVQRLLYDVRASLAGVLSPGQDPSYWLKRLEEVELELDAGLKRIERPGVEAAAAQEIGTAAEAAAALRRYGPRVQALVQEDARAEASRLVFSDASALASTASVAVSQAVSIEGAAAGAELAALRRREVYAAGGGALLSAVALLLLLPLPVGGGAGEHVAAQEAVPAADRGRLFGGPLELDSLGRSGFDLDLDAGGAQPQAPEPASTPEATSPAASAPSAARQGAAPETAARPAPAPSQPAPAREEVAEFPWSSAPSTSAAPAPDLQEAARLCTDLAQVGDTEQLRQLLGRSASLLRASGIVVWLGGVNGASLRPAFSYGYSQQTLSRLVDIGRDEENAVSAAYRAGRMQAVAAEKGGAGALVAPLLAPAGCVGAMAVEVARGAEQDQGLRALAQLVAAQLATLMPTEGAKG